MIREANDGPNNKIIASTIACLVNEFLSKKDEWRNSTQLT